MSVSNNVIGKNVTMPPELWRVVEQVANDKALQMEGNRSRAMRFIVRDWDERRRQQSGVRMSLGELAEAEEMLAEAVA